MPPQESRYKELVQRFKKTKVLVIGDVMLDLYIRGEVERISPEAPVPIVFERSREYSLGGAGNVAANIAALGGRVTLMGLIGNDAEGKIVEKVCRKSGIMPRFIRVRNRPTTVKMRAVSGSHQLARVDREYIGTINKNAEAQIERAVKKMGEQDVIVLSDYAKGFITKAVIQALKKRFGKEKIIANIKPLAHHRSLFKGIDINFYRGIRLMTMNANEGAFYTDIDTSGDKGAAEASMALSKQLNISVVLTRGEHGLMVYDRNLKKTAQVANRALHVFDVTGAGDTVVASLSLMLGAGMQLFAAAEVANHAGGIVVGRRGTAVVRPVDLKPFFT